MTPSTGLTDEQYRRILAIIWKEDDGEADEEEGGEDDEDDEAIAALASPEELHQLAWNWNWDNGIGVFRQIIRHPLCDRGTALLIYWHAGPRWFYQFADREGVLREAAWGVRSYDLIKEIEDHYCTRVYARAAIAFDPIDDAGSDWTTDYEDEESK